MIQRRFQVKKNRIANGFDKKKSQFVGLNDKRYYFSIKNNLLSNFLYKV